jgi:hypothetical protein
MEQYATTSRISIQLTSAVLGTACLPVMSLLHLPVWIAFLAWAAAGWVKEKRLLSLLWKLWPSFLIGTGAGALDSLLVQWYQSQVVGATVALSTIISMVILFVIVFGVLSLARTATPLSEAGAIFIGLNSYFSLSLLPRFSLFPGTVGCFLTATVLCLLGPVLYWLAELLTFAQPGEKHAVQNWKTASETSQQEQPQHSSSLASVPLVELGQKQKTIELNGGNVIIAYTQNDDQEREPLPLTFATATIQGGSSE